MDSESQVEAAQMSDHSPPAQPTEATADDAIAPVSADDAVEHESPTPPDPLEQVFDVIVMGTGLVESVVSG